MADIETYKFTIGTVITHIEERRCDNCVKVSKCIVMYGICQDPDCAPIYRQVSKGVGHRTLWACLCRSCLKKRPIIREIQCDRVLGRQQTPLKRRQFDAPED